MMGRRAFIGLSLALLCPAPSLAQDPGGAHPRISAMGFGDIAYLATDREMPDGFLIGQLVGHVNAAVTDRFSVFGEVSATGRSTGFVIEAERLIVRYDFNDYFKLSAGRYHTPISFWNTAYHHGAWLQSSVARPEVVRFGSRLIPVHFIGAMAEGNVGPHDLGLGYTAGVGNGRGENIARAGDDGDVNSSRAWILALHVRPDAFAGLQAGAALYGDRVTPPLGSDLRERIASVHLAWTRERPELIAEFLRFDHRPQDDGETSTTTDALYAQLAWRLTGSASAFKPYVRYEWIDIGDDELLFGTFAEDYRAGIAGIRYDFSPFAALKAEYRNERFATPERFHSVYVQASFAIASLGGGGSNVAHGMRTRVGGTRRPGR